MVASVVASIHSLHSPNPTEPPCKPFTPTHPLCTPSAQLTTQPSSPNPFKPSPPLPSPPFQELHLLHLCVPQSPSRLTAHSRAFPVRWTTLRALFCPSLGADAAHLRAVASLLSLNFQLLDELAADAWIDPSMLGHGAVVGAAKWERLWHATLLLLLINNAEPARLKAIFAPGGGGTAKAAGGGEGKGQAGGGAGRSGVANAVPVVAGVGGEEVAAMAELREAAARRAGDLERFCERMGAGGVNGAGGMNGAGGVNGGGVDETGVLGAACVGNTGGCPGWWSVDPSGGGSWWMLRELLRPIRDRLWTCVRQELLPLYQPRLPAMNAVVASALYKVGRGGKAEGGGGCEELGAACSCDGSDGEGSSGGLRREEHCHEDRASRPTAHPNLPPRPLTHTSIALLPPYSRTRRPTHSPPPHPAHMPLRYPKALRPPG